MYACMYIYIYVATHFYEVERMDMYDTFARPYTRSVRYHQVKMVAT